MKLNWLCSFWMIVGLTALMLCFWSLWTLQQHLTIFFSECHYHFYTQSCVRAFPSCLVSLGPSHTVLCEGISPHTVTCFKHFWHILLITSWGWTELCGRAFVYGVMGHQVDPSWWTHLHIYCSSQCPMTGVPTTMVCTILSVWWCI